MSQSYLFDYVATGQGGHFTLRAVGYLLSDWDCFYGNGGDGLGASSIYRVFELLTYLRDGYDFPDCIYAAYGQPSYLDCVMKDDVHGLQSVGYTNPSYGYFDAWLFHFMWGYWYQG